MKLHKFYIRTYKDWITFIPTIELHIGSPMYSTKNLTLIISIFIWHFKWFFIKEDKE